MVLIHREKEKLTQTHIPHPPFIPLLILIQTSEPPNASIILVKTKFLISNLISYYTCITHPKVIFILFLKYITS